MVEGLRAAEQARQSRIAELLETSGDPRVPPPRGRHKRDRHGMHIVRGVCPVALGGGLAHWLLRARWHRMVAGTVIATMAAAAPLSPDLLQPAPAAQVPAYHHVARHHQPSVPVTPPVVLPRRKRRSAGANRVPRPVAPRRPSPSPTVSVPVPTPLPTIPLPAPSPSPTCVRVTGGHCHPGLGALAGDAVNVPWALRGLTAQP